MCLNILKRMQAVSVQGIYQEPTLIDRQKETGSSFRPPFPIHLYSFNAAEIHNRIA